MLRVKAKLFFTPETSISTIKQSCRQQVFPEEKIDVLILECTRGDHAKPEGWTRAGEEQRLAEALVAAFERTRAC
jgi:hypothetical protein